jgi:protein gp37
MAENSGIAWTDNTFNPWVGCTKIGPGCDHCYAEAMDHRFGGGHWGAGAPRKRTTPANWAKVRKWDRDALKSGTRPWVFVASLADVFDNEVPGEWRCDLFNLVAACKNLNFQFVTKRIGNAAFMLPQNFANLYPHVGIIATVVTQAECDRDLPKLLAVDCAWRGLSIEPQLGPISFSDNWGWLENLDWIICGGESGHGARPMRLDWFHILLNQCRAAGVPFFGKQLGRTCIMSRSDAGQPVAIGAGWEGRAGHDSGLVTFRDRAGADPIEWPPELRVREMPRGVPTTLTKRIGEA